MDIAVLGTGGVGRAVAGRLAELGHNVTIGTRDQAETLARQSPDAMGNPPYSEWAAWHPEVRLSSFERAAAQAEIVVNATPGAATMEVLHAAGSENLAGKVLIDISNPLDFSAGFPPNLFVKDTDSLGEQVQAAFPETLVVKTLNTLAATLMVNPAQLANGEHTIFVSGNDVAAKKAVTDILHSFGHEDIIDLGDITTARGTEMFLALWLRLMGSLGSPIFNFKVVR
jgi:predicted dinucleotide-binding enzyme